MRRLHRRRALIVVLVLGTLVACRGTETRYTGPYAREVNRAIPLLEKSTGLTFKTPPKLEERTRDEVREFLEQQFNEQVTPLEFAGTAQAYRRLGLLPDTLDLRSFLLDLLTEQVAGYYDPSTKVLYVVADGPPEIRDVTIVHELVHALQDQYVRLDSVQSLKGDNDRQVAIQAVLEGQAVYEHLSAMLGGSDFSLRLPGGWGRAREMIESQSASMPLFARAPLLIKETLIFPYLSGAEFVRVFKGARPRTPPYSPLASSTEQILHPDRYLDSLPDVPTRIALGAPSTGSIVHEDNLGEFETRIFLFDHLKDQALATQGAAGWDGDRYQLVNTSAGEGLTWLTVWDTSVEAAEFRDLMERVIERRFKVKAGTGGDGTTRRWTAGARRLLLSMETVGGRPAIIFEDAPVGLASRLLVTSRVTLSEAR